MCNKEEGKMDASLTVQGGRETGATGRGRGGLKKNVERKDG